MSQDLQLTLRRVLLYQNYSAGYSPGIMQLLNAPHAACGDMTSSPSLNTARMEVCGSAKIDVSDNCNNTKYISTAVELCSR
jgi:hypothetical protein